MPVGYQFWLISWFLFSSRLNITCENEGCTAIVKLDALVNHLAECDFNPKKLVECENGCGMMISKDNVTVRIGFLFFKERGFDFDFSK